MRRFTLCILLLGMIVGMALPAAAAKRVALVIGNGAYQNAGLLPNPVNDGRAVAEALRRLDFVVIEATDQDKAGMQKLLRQFSAELEGADASVFFYAGHGLQVQGQNYLVPVDAALESEVDLPFEAVSVDVVLDLMEQTTPQRLVFLDACRDNPLARRLARAVGKSRSLGIGRGLARMNNRVGTLIAFATEPDKVALDGEGEHSPFTQALLEYIETPGLEVRQMLSRVRATVIDETEGQQLPLDTSALVDDFYFAAPPEPTPAPSATVAAPVSTENLFWQSIQASDDANDFRAYLERYPDGSFAPLARNRLSALGAAPRTEVAAVTPPTRTGPTETPSPEPPVATLPAPPPPPAVEIEPLDATMVATRNVNVRGEPNTDGDPLGVVAQGTEVAVVGKVAGANWYRIERPGGGTAYVYAPLLAPPEAKPVQAASAQAAATQSEPAQAKPVEMAAVAPGVAAPSAAVQQAARAGAVPRVDAAALLQSLGQRTRNALLRFTSRTPGSGDFVAFDRWDDVGADDDAPRWAFGDGGRTRVQRSSEPFGEALMASQVGPETFGVLMFSQLMTGGRANFRFVTAASALHQWSFLAEHGARVQDTASLIFDTVQFEVAALTLSPGAPAQSCLGFVGIQASKRVDGFVCRIQGPAFVAGQASDVLSQIHVPRFIEP